MGLTRQQARAVIATYIEAWETQDPGLIVTIFTPGATYHERVMQDPIPDREAIRRYWESKVVESQANIRCELLNLYLDGDTVIAEWLAEFDDRAKGVRKRMKEIAVLTFEGELISSLREYWASEEVGLLERSARAGGAWPSRAAHAASVWSSAMRIPFCWPFRVGVRRIQTSVSGTSATRNTYT
jgi:ketosteroid isomerase-like protein